MMERWELPKGWEWKKVGEVAQDTERRNPSLRPDESFSYVDIAAIDNKNYCIRLECVKKIKGKDAPSRARKVIHANDVIFATTRPYLKNIAIVPQALDNQICSTGFCVLRAKPGMAIPKYLFFAVLTNSFIHQLTPKGANYPAVNDSDIYQAIIPIPYSDDPARSLAEQRRIVARLELLLGETRAMREDIQAMRRDLAQVMESVLAEVFPNPNEEMPEGWDVQEVRTISEPPQYGYTQSATTENTGTKFLRITDIQNGNVEWDEVPYCQIDDNNFDKYALFDGDIVFARSGATTGKTFLLKNPPRAVFASYLIRLRIRGIFPDFVYWFFQSSHYWNQVRLRGGAQPNMNANLLSQILVPIPKSLSEQRRIVAYLEHIAEEIRAMDDLLAQDLRDIETLEQSILAAAFRGEV
jgi:type I restriction enzyme S subunit